MNKEELVDYAIKLDKDIKEKKKELDEIKATLQTRALSEIENMNIKYIQYYGKDGSCDITYRQKCEIDNISLLEEIFGRTLDNKITKEEKIIYTIDSKFKEALTALYLKDYKPDNIDQILTGLGLDSEQIKLAYKKLNGNYFKDKEFLESIGIDTEAIEEELDAIRESKNYELINKYIDIEKFSNEDYQKLQRAISVEETLGIGLSYSKNRQA